MTYQVFDRNYDYVLVYENGFYQVCRNAALLGKAVQYAHSRGHIEVLPSPETLDSITLEMPVE